MLQTLIFGLLVHPLHAQVGERIERFLAREVRYAVLPGHESTVRVRRLADGTIQKTPYAVLIISGLFNSPRSVRPIEDFFAERGLNVVSQRLAGHYETDRSALESRVSWPMWRGQSQRAFELARELGDRVILIGHSTGGVLVTWLAIDDPDPVAGLALFAPAFGLRPFTSALVTVLKALRYGSTLPDGRFKTGHAAVEVRKLGEAFRAEITRGDRAGFAHAAKRLADVPVWMGNTAVEVIVNLRLAKTFYAELDREARAARIHDLRPRCELLIHDRLASARNPRLTEQLLELDRMFRGRS